MKGEGLKVKGKGQNQRLSCAEAQGRGGERRVFRFQQAVESAAAGFSVQGFLQGPDGSEAVGVGSPVPLAAGPLNFGVEMLSHMCSLVYTFRSRRV